MADKDKSPLVSVGRYTELAFLLPVSTLVGYLMGRGLDRLFGTGFFYLIFLVLGIVAGFVALFRQLDRQMKRDGS